jgi:hypothetical protein
MIPQARIQCVRHLPARPCMFLSSELLIYTAPFLAFAGLARRASLRNRCVVPMHWNCVPFGTRLPHPRSHIEFDNAQVLCRGSLQFVGLARNAAKSLHLFGTSVRM